MNPKETSGTTVAVCSYTLTADSAGGNIIVLENIQANTRDHELCLGHVITESLIFHSFHPGLETLNSLFL